MKFLTILVLILSMTVVALAQNEQAPIADKDLEYKDWIYKNVITGTDTNLRKFTFGKKLVMVAYFAPWCPNWKHDAAFVQGMYDKYKASGFDVIGIGEYDPVDAVKSHIDQYKLTFPVVFESNARSAMRTTAHYQYRKAAGDERKWGSPWYVFLEVDKLTPGGLIMAKRVPIVNGELMKEDVEKFIAERVTSPMRKSDGVTISASKKIEACAPDTATVLKPTIRP